MMTLQIISRWASPMEQWRNLGSWALSSEGRLVFLERVEVGTRPCCFPAKCHVNQGLFWDSSWW